MAPSWKDVRPVLILVTDLSGGGCDFKVGEDANNLKKHLRRSAKKDEPIFWQVVNNWR